MRLGFLVCLFQTFTTAYSGWSSLPTHHLVLRAVLITKGLLSPPLHPAVVVGDVHSYRAIYMQGSLSVLTLQVYAKVRGNMEGARPLELWTQRVDGSLCGTDNKKDIERLAVIIVSPNLAIGSFTFSIRHRCGSLSSTPNHFCVATRILGALIPAVS